eukprot:TRINITY_DN2616_c0_g1_i1.p1 TRINITY_DN2616_c0_g1~~TRINITY_DN2616_c0_g1_i1.p1  ORF type:complete len:123 (-),score=26.04 TRINITY_DN2616_c0_g1_i1:486-800(-)
MFGEEDPRATREGAIKLARLYFIGGFFGLPFLWLVNVFYFRQMYYKISTPEEIKRYVRRSFIFWLLSMIVLLIWFIVYQVKKSQWQSISMNILTDELSEVLQFF